MKRSASRIEEIFIEIAFAEEREIRLLKNISGRFTEWLDSHFTAITFAEAGEFETATDFIGGDSGDSSRHVEHCLRGLCTGMA